jgi:dihydrofolate reductase
LNRVAASSGSEKGDQEVGKLVVTQFVSVDGVFQDPGGVGEIERGGWSFKSEHGDEFDRLKLDELMAADAQLLGRVTYEGFAKAWPDMTDEQGFAEKMNSMPKYVVSTTLENPTWTNTTVIKDNVAEEVAKLKKEVDGDILVAGSGRLVQTLVDEDLVDEWRLMIFPIIVGQGKHLFGEQSELSMLKLTDSKPIGPDGIIVLTYERAS